jgi:nucleoside-diphosphate kinase
MVHLFSSCSPHTLRAKYGLSSASPAIHCTDLAEDGPLEAEYLFVLLEQ